MSEAMEYSMPRVLMVTGAYYPEMSSSAIQCREMARLLSGRARIHVLTTAVDAALASDDVIDGVAVTRVHVDVASAMSKAGATARMIMALLRLLPQSDVVHLHGFSTKNVLVTALARVFRRRIVVHLHTSGFDEASAIRKHGALAWWAFTRAHRYLSVSPALVDAYLDAGLPAERIWLVPNGIDIERFAPANRAEKCALRGELNVPRDLPLILFVGFFSRDKQPRVLFDAWWRLYERSVEATLVFVGATRSKYFEVDDDLALQIRDEAARRGVPDRVVFAGTTHDVERYFRAADIFALPSRREGLPVALLEAMACGLACAASRLPGSTDGIIEHERNGLLVPVGDIEALASALQRFVREPAFAAAVGAAARETIVRRFPNDDTAELWLTAYRQVLAMGTA
jgi:glycosyltransferase involved in cell wall biosynthesis